MMHPDGMSKSQARLSFRFMWGLQILHCVSKSIVRPRLSVNLLTSSAQDGVVPSSQVMTVRAVKKSMLRGSICLCVRIDHDAVQNYRKNG
jgi:hypothetical protein